MSDEKKEEIKKEEDKTLAALNDNVNEFIAEGRKAREEFEKGYIKKSDLDEKLSKITARFDEVETKLTRPPVGESKVDLKEPEIKAFNAFLRKGVGSLTPEERKVLTIADTTHAGVLAPYEYVQQIIKALVPFSPIRSLATVRQTKAYAVEIPTETTLAAATWVAESVEKTETTSPIYGLTEIKTFEMKYLIKATQKMLEDSAFPLEQEIAEITGKKFGQLEDTAFHGGNGTTAPEGLTINTTVVAAARNFATDNVLGFADFLAVQYDLKTPYVKNASWLLARSTLGYVLGLKSATTNTYLLQPNLQQGQPATILGSPVYEDTNFAAGNGATADAAIVAAYGDFKAGYMIADRIDIIIQRLIEKYAEFGMIGFLARKRVGGCVVLPEAIYLLKNITT